MPVPVTRTSQEIDFTLQPRESYLNQTDPPKHPTANALQKLKGIFLQTQPARPLSINKSSTHDIHNNILR
jgi:hypothetical protein